MSSRSIAITFVILCFHLVCQTAARAQDSTAEAPSAKTGEFTTTFTQRSLLSSDEEIARRLPDKQHHIAADYQIDKMPFRVYVPRSEVPEQGDGLIVFICYKATQDAAPSLQPLLDERHLIFAVSQNLPDSSGAAIGTTLDAVYNLKKQYHIDPTRVWVLGEEPAEMLALAYPDVFTGGIYRNYQYFRPIKSHQPNSGFYPAGLPHPPAKYLDQAKAHPQVILTWPEAQMDEFKKLLPGAFKADGFSRVLSIEVGIEPYHYPNFQPDWFAKVIDFMDESAGKGAGVASREPGALSTGAGETGQAASTAPTESATGEEATTRPAGVPASSDPKKLLNLAKNYIAAHAYGPARVRLNLIITKFPNDPAAAEAKQLLDTLPAQ